MTQCSLSKQEQVKSLSKRVGTFIAEFEVAQEKVEQWQSSTSLIIAQHQADLAKQLELIAKQSQSLSEMMTDTGAARFRVATEQHVEQGRQYIEKLDALFQRQQENFNKQQQKIDDIVSAHLEEMKKAEKRVAFKIQNFIEQFNVEEMRELADTARHAIEESSSSAIFQSQKFLERFHWKNIGFILLVVSLNTLVMGLYLSDEMPWEIHQHAKQERFAGQTLLNAWPSLDKKARHDILAHSKKKTHAKGA